MLAESLRTRGINFAFLFGPPRLIERQEASQIHNRICDEFKLDDFAFRYNSTDVSMQGGAKAFSILVERQEGRGRFRVILDNAGAPKPMRLLMEYHWPISPDIDAKERFDMAAAAVFENLRGPYHRILAEARIRAQCEVAGGNARAYLIENLLNLKGTRAAALGSPATFASVTLHAVPPEHTNDPLAEPVRELTVEVLREDPKSLYLEFVSRWTHSPAGKRIEAALHRPVDERPGAYVEAAQSHLRRLAAALV